MKQTPVLRHTQTAFRELATVKDKGKGLFTFNNHKGKSTIDYVLCDKISIYNVLDFKVHPVNEYSDHAIVSFNLKY